MPDAILVGYATRSGSTKEIAEAIGATLRAGPREVAVKPLKDVKSPSLKRGRRAFGDFVHYEHW